MGVNSSIFNFKKAPAAFLLFLALATGFETAIAHFNRVPDYTLKKKLVETGTLWTDILFLGDSSLTSNLDTALFEKNTGLSVYSYGTARSLGMASYYLFFRHYLRHQPAPQSLVLMIVPHTLAVTVGQSYYYYFDYYFHADTELFRILKNGLTPGLLFRYFILSRLPSILHRSYLSDMFIPQRRKSYEEDYRHFLSVRADLITNKGTMQLDDEKYKLECAAYVKEHGESPYFVSTESRYYLGKILDLAASRGIRVFYVADPIAGECYSPRQIEEVKAMHRKIIEDFPQMTPLEPDVLVYPKEKFSNTSFHLNKTNARIFTQEIAKKIKVELVENS